MNGMLDKNAKYSVMYGDDVVAKDMDFDVAQILLDNLFCEWSKRVGDYRIPVARTPERKEHMMHLAYMLRIKKQEDTDD